MKTRIHALAGLLAMLIIASFWASTFIAEVFLSQYAVAWVKHHILLALMALIPLLMITGVSGFALGKKSENPLIITKRRRMPFIVFNGLVILVPAAIYLNWKAQAGMFDTGFYAVQVLELLAGATNLLLMAMNARDGLKIRQRAK
jgi:hypothetical protein